MNRPDWVQDHHAAVVDAAREYVEAIEAEVGKDITAWLETKQAKFLALKEALAELVEGEKAGND